MGERLIVRGMDEYTCNLHHLHLIIIDDDFSPIMVF